MKSALLSLSVAKIEGQDDKADVVSDGKGWPERTPKPPNPDEVVEHDE